MATGSSLRHAAHRRRQVVSAPIDGAPSWGMGGPDGETGPGEAGLDERVIDVVSRHPSVEKVTFVGSRARGDHTPWSDWDFAVATRDFPSLAEDLPELVAPLSPILRQWDRLGDHRCYMLLVHGPAKVDLIFDEPHVDEEPWTVSAGTLPGIDAHVWDWLVWLLSKQAAGQDELVRGELDKMFVHLLGPMGVAEAPKTIDEAVARYLEARDEQERRFGVRVPRAAGHEVRAALARWSSAG
jgi:predicted nucleotidyltransferase